MNVVLVSTLISLISQCCFIVNCEDDEATYNNNYNIKLLHLERDILRLQTNQCERSKHVDELVGLSKVPLVAFRSVLQNNISLKPYEIQILHFDIVQFNLGDGYDNTTGLFTAPVDGLYMFSMKLGNAPGDQGDLFLVQEVGPNRRTEYIDFTFVGYNNGWTSGSTSSVTLLKAGDVVRVELQGVATGTNKNSNRYTTAFSGTLLHLL